MKVLLLVPHFWDPVCVPLGICALKAFVETRGHTAELYDFNTDAKIFGIQRQYFDEGKRQFPYWKKWNIARNGTEMLAIHQMVYLFGRMQPNYADLVTEAINMNGRPHDAVRAELDVQRFDQLLDRLYQVVSTRMESLLLEHKPDVVGCSLMNSTWPGTLFLLKKVKELLPNTRTVVGGPGPIMGITANAEQVRTFFDAHDFLDYFVVGEGEEPLLRILDNPDLPRGILDPNAGRDLAQIKKTALTMDELPQPNYGNLPLDRYLQLSVSTSRGCPFECSFCAETVFWKGFRTVNYRKMFDRIDDLAKRNNRTSFYICDSLSNQVIGPLTAAVASHNAPYTFDCYLRADPICTSEERTRAWKQGGLFRARLGLESASQRILDEMVKKTNPETMAKSLHALAQAGVYTSTLWIACYPGETDAEFESTLQFIRENRKNIYQADVWLFQYHPDGLRHSDDIRKKQGSRYRFSSDINRILNVTPYVVERDLTPMERFDRLERFVAEMATLEIPNPYSIYEIVSASGRWVDLGRDAKWTPQASMMALNA
jgi:radical SAM superfamily enzyme YgiQ (UPF0313 family)